MAQPETEMGTDSETGGGSSRESPGGMCRAEARSPHLHSSLTYGRFSLTCHSLRRPETDTAWASNEEGTGQERGRAGNRRAVVG